MTKASDLFIESLENEGVEYIFGVPGEENLDFLDSLSRSTKIKLILTRHEQAAGFMAATYGRHTGKTGVCLAPLGPGATNFATAAAYGDLAAGLLALVVLIALRNRWTGTMALIWLGAYFWSLAATQASPLSAMTMV